MGSLMVTSEGKDKKAAPPPPDFQGAAQDQLAANRPNQQNAFGGNVGWTQGPDGQWTQSQSFGGPMGGLSNALQGQAASSMSQPLDFSGLSPLDTGAGARDQAIQAAYGQATSRLDPQWAQRDEQLGAQLANQGLAPGSEAYNNAMQQQTFARNDAYGGAMNSAIGQGQAAGDSVFRNSMMGRAQGMSELLRQRGQPLEDMQQLQQLLQQPQFAQDQSALAAALAQGNFDMNRWQTERGGVTDAISGGAEAGSSILKLLFGL